MTGWIQITASIGLIAGLLVILATRTALGEEAFLAWGWRIPFLVSVLLLVISVWMRFKLSESPAFAKLKAEGEVTKAPLRESFAQWDNLKRVLIAFFGIMCAQGAVWYLTFFYVQVFLDPLAGRARADQGHAGARRDPGQRAALRLLRLAQRPGRPQAGDARRHAAGARRLLPRLPRHRRGGQPGAGRGAGAATGHRPCRSRDLLGPVRPGRHAPLRFQLRHRQEPARLDRHFLREPRASAAARRWSPSAASGSRCPSGARHRRRRAEGAQGGDRRSRSRRRLPPRAIRPGPSPRR